MINRRRLEKEKEMRIGTWNITSMTGKEVEVVQEMKKYNVQILGVCETKKKGHGEMVLDSGYVFRYSGVLTGRAKEGVGIIVNPETDKKVTSWEPISSRILSADLELEEKLTMVQVYAPTEDSDAISKEMFYSDLQKCLDRIRSDGRKAIVMGDFNGRIGQDFRRGHGTMGMFGGERTRNDNGDRLIEFCIHNKLGIGNTFYPHKHIHQVTFRAETRNVESIIDYVIFDSDIKKYVHDVKVIRGAELSTDHKLLIAKTKFRKIKKETVKRYRRIKTEELQNEECAKVYTEILSGRIEEWENRVDERNLHENWNSLKEIILMTAKEVCTEKIVNTSRKRTAWWSETVKEKVKEKKDAYKKFITTKSEEDKEKYIEIRNEAKRLVREAKNKSWEDFGNSVEEDYRGNNRIFWKRLRSMRKKYGKPCKSVRDENNKLATESKEVLETWRKFYGKKFEDTDRTEESEIREDLVGNMSISREEVKAAVKMIKTGKAAGSDGIAPEMIKKGGTKMIDAMTKICQESWNKKEIPVDWENNIITPIYKKGNSSDCNNYRAVCLSNVALKLYTRIIERKLRGYVENQFEEEQAAFRPGRQAQDHIYTLRTISEKMLETNREFYLAFIDLKAAFDTVNRRRVWEVCRRKGVPEYMVQVMESLYQRVTGVVRINGKTSETFRINKGLKQGDCLSPLLFITLMDDVTKKCSEKTRKTKIGNWNMEPVWVQNLLFADDIALIADTKEKLQNLVTEWTEELEERGMEVNRKKSKVMKFSRNGEIDENMRITCGDEELEQVTSYEYLGALFTSDGKIEEELKNRVRKATNVYFQINNTLIGKKEVSQEAKKRVFNSVYIPTLTYGSESWPTSKSQESKVVAAEMKYLRRSIGKTRRDRLRNEVVRAEVGVKPVWEQIEKKQLKWFGHVVRMDRRRKPKQVLEARTEGRKLRGRPRTTFLDRIEELGRKRGKPTTEMRKLAKNRKEWRVWTEATPTP